MPYVRPYASLGRGAEGLGYALASGLFGERGKKEAEEEALRQAILEAQVKNVPAMAEQAQITGDMGPLLQQTIDNPYLFALANQMGLPAQATMQQGLVGGGVPLAGGGPGGYATNMPTAPPVALPTELNDLKMRTLSDVTKGRGLQPPQVPVAEQSGLLNALPPSKAEEIAKYTEEFAKVTPAAREAWLAGHPAPEGFELPRRARYSLGPQTPKDVASARDVYGPENMGPKKYRRFGETGLLPNQAPVSGEPATIQEVVALSKAAPTATAEDLRSFAQNKRNIPYGKMSSQAAADFARETTEKDLDIQKKQRDLLTPKGTIGGLAQLLTLYDAKTVTMADIDHYMNTGGLRPGNTMVLDTGKASALPANTSTVNLAAKIGSLTNDTNVPAIYDNLIQGNLASIDWAKFITNMQTSANIAQDLAMLRAIKNRPNPSQKDYQAVLDSLSMKLGIPIKEHKKFWEKFMPVLNAVIDRQATQQNLDTAKTEEDFLNSF